MRVNLNILNYFTQCRNNHITRADKVQAPHHFLS